MDSKSRANRSAVRLVQWAAIPLIALLVPATAAQAQTAPPILPSCSTQPADTDTWPVANTDALGTAPGTPITFMGATLLANDVGTALRVSMPNGMKATAHGVITGSDPFTYTPDPLFAGTDTFTYEITDSMGHTAIGLARVGVTPDTVPPQVAITAPAAGVVSGSVTITATAFDAGGIGGVLLFVDGVQLGPEVTAAPYQASWNTAAIADGSHTLTATARDRAGNVANAGAVVVTVSNVVMPTAPGVDKMVFADGLNKRTTPAFSTTVPGDVLVAFAASDGPAAVNGQRLTIAGAGLTWTRLQRANTSFGVSEIWTATATGLLSNVTVSSTQAVTGYRQSLTVIAFSGVSGIGASSAASGATGAAAVGLTTQANGSLVYAIGNDWDRAVARVYPAGQVKVREVVDSTVGDTFWVQSLAAPVAGAGTSVTLNVASPTTDRWNLAAVELRGGAATVPATVPVPSVVGMTDGAARSAITAAGLAVGSVTSENSSSVAVGLIIRQTPVAGTGVAPSSAVGYVLSLGPAATGGPTVDASASADGTGAQTATLTTTAPGDVLVALVGSDGPTSGANNQFITVSGGGLSWSRVARAATARGVAEIWTATAATALSGAAITSTQSVTSVLGGPVNQSLTVIAFANASGIGASNIGSAASGAPSVSIAAQAAGSAVYGVGIDFDRAVARTLPANQTKVHEFLAPSGDTMWAQALVGTTSSAGVSVTLNATAPTTDQWNLAVVEIKR